MIKDIITKSIEEVKQIQACTAEDREKIRIRYLGTKGL